MLTTPGAVLHRCAPIKSIAVPPALMSPQTMPVSMATCIRFTSSSEYELTPFSTAFACDLHASMSSESHGERFTSPSLGQGETSPKGHSCPQRGHLARLSRVSRTDPRHVSQT